MNKSDLFKRAWALKKKKPMLSFSKCLKWSWNHTGAVFGKAKKAIAVTEFVLTDGFMVM